MRRVSALCSRTGLRVPSQDPVVILQLNLQFRAVRLVQMGIDQGELVAAIQRLPLAVKLHAIPSRQTGPERRQVRSVILPSQHVLM